MLNSFQQDRRSFLLGVGVIGIGQVLAQRTIGAEDGARQEYVLGSNEGEHLVHFRDRGKILIKVGSTTGSETLALGTQQVMAGTGIPIHRYLQMDEAFYILEGSGICTLNDERHAFEGLADGNQTHAHYALAQILQLPADALTRFLQGTPNCSRRHALQFRHLILEAGTADDEFADDAHQFVEPVEIDAHDACRSDRRNRLRFSCSRRGLDGRRLERQSVCCESGQRRLVCFRRENELKRYLSSAFHDRLRLDQLSDLL